MSLWMLNLNVGQLMSINLSHIIIHEYNLKFEIVFYIVGYFIYFLALINILTLKTRPSSILDANE